MIFTETPLKGAFLVQSEPAADERGHFVRTFCAREFSAQGLDARLAQTSLSYNRQAGTLRGLHFQAAPHAEAKTVRCLRGRAYDVIVDLRPDSPTRHQWFGFELSAEAGNSIHIPVGFAHGFLTLEDHTTLEYFISTEYVAAAARGVRFDDPQLAIRWPAPPSQISPRDRTLPFVSNLDTRE